MEIKMTLSEFERSAMNPYARQAPAVLAILREFAELRMDELFDPRLRERIPEMPGEMISAAGVVVRDEISEYRFGDVVLCYPCPRELSGVSPADSDISMPDGVFDLAMLPFGLIQNIRPKKKEDAPAPQMILPEKETPRTYSIPAQLIRMRRLIGKTAPASGDGDQKARLEALRKKVTVAAAGMIPPLELHMMLLNLRVCDLFDALAPLPYKDDIDFKRIASTVYALARFTPKPSAGVRVTFDRDPEDLTLGNMLFLAGEFIVHPDEYGERLEHASAGICCPAVTAGYWLLEKLMILPFRLLAKNDLFTAETPAELWHALTDEEAEALLFDDFDEVEFEYPDCDPPDEWDDEWDDEESDNPEGHPSSSGRD